MVEFWRYLIATVLLILVALAPESSCSRDEDRLLKFLLDNYQKYGRPGEEDERVNVSYGLSLMQIINYSPISGSVSIEVWENVQWEDKRLSWEVDTFGGVQSIRLPPSEIWTPDITPYNGWSNRDNLYNIVVYSSGLCIWVPKHFWQFYCTQEDSEANCALKLGSWTYDGTKLNLTSRSDKADVSTFRTDDRFKLVDNRIARQINYYECCPEPYISINFNFTLEVKKPLPNSGMSISPSSFLGSHAVFFGIWILIVFFAT